MMHPTNTHLAILNWTSTAQSLSHLEVIAFVHCKGYS